MAAAQAAAAAAARETEAHLRQQLRVAEQQAAAAAQAQRQADERGGAAAAAAAAAEQAAAAARAAAAAAEQRQVADAQRRQQLEEEVAALRQHSAAAAATAAQQLAEAKGEVQLLQEQLWEAQEQVRGMAAAAAAARNSSAAAVLQQQPQQSLQPGSSADAVHSRQRSSADLERVGGALSADTSSAGQGPSPGACQHDDTACQESAQGLFVESPSPAFTTCKFHNQHLPSVLLFCPWQQARRTRWRCCCAA